MCSLILGGVYFQVVFPDLGWCIFLNRVLWPCFFG